MIADVVIGGASGEVVTGEWGFTLLRVIWEVDWWLDTWSWEDEIETLTVSGLADDIKLRDFSRLLLCNPILPDAQFFFSTFRTYSSLQSSNRSPKQPQSLHPAT